MLEAKAPKKTMRNVRCDSAARAVPDRAGSGVSPSTTASSISSREMEPSAPADAAPGPGPPSGRGSSDEGGTRPSYGRPLGGLPGQGPAAEQMEPQGTSNADAGATGTVSSEAAPALC